MLRARNQRCLNNERYSSGGISCEPNEKQGGSTSELEGKKKKERKRSNNGGVREDGEGDEEGVADAGWWFDFGLENGVDDLAHRKDVRRRREPSLGVDESEVLVAGSKKLVPRVRGEN